MTKHCYACKRPAKFLDDRFHCYWCSDDCLGRFLVLLREDLKLREEPSFVDGPITIKELEITEEFQISGSVVTLAQKTKPEKEKTKIPDSTKLKVSDLSKLIEGEQRRKNLLASLFPPKEP